MPFICSAYLSELSTVIQRLKTHDCSDMEVNFISMSYFVYDSCHYVPHRSKVWILQTFIFNFTHNCWLSFIICPMHCCSSCDTRCTTRHHHHGRVQAGDDAMELVGGTAGSASVALNEAHTRLIALLYWLGNIGCEVPPHPPTGTHGRLLQQ